jgi:hypothetical protein
MKFYHASQSAEATRAGIVRDIRDVTTYNLLFGADWGDFAGFAPGDEVLVWVPGTGMGEPGAYGVAVVTGPATPLVEHEELLEEGVLYGDYRNGLDGDVVIPIRWVVCRFSDRCPSRSSLPTSLCLDLRVRCRQPTKQSSGRCSTSLLRIPRADEVDPDLALIATSVDAQTSRRSSLAGGGMSQADSR